MDFGFYIMFAAGLFIAVLGVLAYFSEKKKQHNCFYQQLATFVDYKVEEMADEDGDSYNMYFPIFKYSFNNDDYTVEYTHGYTTKPFKENDEIAILIDPENPSSYIVDGIQKQESSFFLVFVAAGILMMVVSFFI